MALVGLKDLVAWPLTKDDKETLTYGEKFVIAKAIKADLKPQSVDAELFADDGLDEYYAAISAFDISLNINDLTPEIKAKLLGYKIDSKGMVAISSEAEAPYFAVAFRSKLSKGGYEYRNLLKVRFSPSDESFETQGSSINFQTPTINGKAMQTENNGNFGFQIRESETNNEVVAKWLETPVTTLSED